MKPHALRCCSLLAVLVIFPVFCHATYPDGAFGTYEYASKDLSVKVDWNAERINVVVNGRGFNNVKSGADENRDNFGSNGAWPFLIVVRENERSAAYLHLTLLFDEGRITRVGAIYYEREISNPSTRQGRIKRSRVFEMRFIKPPE